MFVHISFVDEYYHPDFSSRGLWYRDFKLKFYSIETQRVLILSCVQTWAQAQHRPYKCL